MDEGVHQLLMVKLDDKQLEGSGCVLQCIRDNILETDKVNDTQASFWFEIPAKFKINQSILNIQSFDILFYGVYFLTYFLLTKTETEHQDML